jgi:hypothetical protein
LGEVRQALSQFEGSHGLVAPAELLLGVGSKEMTFADMVRRYVDQAFQQAMQGRRALSSSLSWPRLGIIEVEVPG